MWSVLFAKGRILAKFLFLLLHNELLYRCIIGWRDTQNTSRLKWMGSQSAHIADNISINVCHVYSVHYGSKIKSIPSIIFHAIYGAVCFQITNWGITLFYHRHQIGNMNHWSLFRIVSWNNGMRCMSCYVLCSFMEIAGADIGILMMPSDKPAKTTRQIWGIW